MSRSGLHCRGVGEGRGRDSKWAVTLEEIDFVASSYLDAWDLEVGSSVGATP